MPHPKDSRPSDSDPRAVPDKIMLDSKHPIAELLSRDDRYPFDAYVFVFEALRFAQEKLGMGTEYLAEDYAADLGDDSEEEESLGPQSEEKLREMMDDLGIEHDLDEEDEPERHVSGQELCEAMRQYAHEQYGYLAKSVLNHWNICTTGDFGELVFNLIKIEQMRKTPHDHREDFDDVFDFDEGFQHNFQFSKPDSSEEHRS